jgi:hypothetical protein
VNAAGRPPAAPRCFELGREPLPEELELGLAASGEEPERQLYCFVCGSAVTRERERIAVEGAHEHTFTNPAGYVFRIGCFRAAPGCSQAGEYTEEFSWFRQCAWRYALCSSCRVHLGWAYRGGEASEFYGLVLDRLLGSRQLFASDS